MKVSSNKYIQLSRLCLWCNLLFFVQAVTSGCHSDQSTEIRVDWNGQRARSIHIPSALLPENNIDSAKYYLRVQLVGDTTGILGDYREEKGIVFEPLIPFTRGTDYEVWYRTKKIGAFSTPDNTADAPELVMFYPQTDTLPVNLLKVYLQFSQPMREAVSAQYIRLVKNDRDTLHDVFLDLQPELWNENRTVLTLWFDPGRIKRDLQPNQRMGAPLEKNNRYRIVVLPGWQDADGRTTGKPAVYEFVSGNRDGLSPDPAKWNIHSPRTGTADPLVIDIQEPLDHYLLEESIRVTDQKGNRIQGQIRTLDNDTRVQFIPVTNWQQGEYNLIIDSKLEDLAGNNLNKPFDRDVTKTKAPDDAPVHKRTFRVQ